MSTRSFWEKELENLKNSHSLEVPRLDYLDLATSEKVTQKDIAYNLRILAYREDLGNKVCLSAINTCQELTVQELRKDNQKLQADLRNCKREVTRLSAIQESTLQEVQQLRKRRPLSKEDVEELVIKISEQPKFIEQQTEALTELSQKVDKIEKLIKVIVGE